MQAVILAAGRGTRMMELTESVPKSMLDVGGKPLLEYKFEALPDEVDEVILIVGYLGGIIQKHFGGDYAGKRIFYVEQGELNGTAGALWDAREILKDRYLVMMGDDIYTRADMEACIAAGDCWRLLVQQLPHMYRAGGVQLGEDGSIAGIAEGDKREAPGLASTNMFLLDTRIFSAPMVPKEGGSLEFGLPQTAVAASKSLGIRFEPVFTDQWIQITSPKDLVYAAEILGKLQN